MVPKHPTGERGAAIFHTVMAGVGAIHVVGGLVMLWWHLTGAKRHWDDVKADQRTRAASGADGD
jgi:hypothetical protein